MNTHPISASLMPTGIPPEVSAMREAARERWRASGTYSRLTLAGELRRATETFGQCEFTYFNTDKREEQTFTLAGLCQEADKVAAGLRDLGLVRGDVVAVQLPNWPEALIAYFACAFAGLAVVPIVEIYSTTELRYIVEETQARALFMASSWRKAGFRERLKDARPETLEHLIIVGGSDNGEDVVEWDALVRLEPRGNQSAADEDPRAPVLVIYTSGGTALPKGVVHSHESLLAEIHSSPLAPSSSGGERYLLCSPPGHIAGLLGLLRSVAYGCTSYILDAWDPPRAKSAVKRYELTSSTVPFFLETLLDEYQSDGDPVPPMTWSVGGSVVPASLTERAEAAGWRTFRAYGSSEHPTVTGALYSDPVEKRTRTEGRIWAESEIRVVDEAGYACPPGISGEILCRGPEQFIGYVSSALNRLAFTPQGWFRTGDVGFLDESGWLVLTDRLKDIIIRGGENISASEVEGVLIRHPAIAEAAVVPYPDPRYGERAAAFVRLRFGEQAPTLPELADFFVREGIAKQKTPERLVPVAELPRTVIGKIDKKELRKLARSDVSPRATSDG